VPWTCSLTWSVLKIIVSSTRAGTIVSLKKRIHTCSYLWSNLKLSSLLIWNHTNKNILRMSGCIDDPMAIESLVGHEVWICRRRYLWLTLYHRHPSLYSLFVLFELYCWITGNFSQNLTVLLMLRAFICCEKNSSMYVTSLTRRTFTLKWCVELQVTGTGTR
jgi:hypothetical protein